MRDVTFSVIFAFCGVGGGALGFQRAQAEFRRLGINARFKILGGIEKDESTARDFERLTGAHLDHIESNNDPSNLRALCQMHHLRHDAADNARRRRENKAAKSGQASLPLNGGDRG